MSSHARRVVARSLLGGVMLSGMAVHAQAQMPVPGGTGVTGLPSPAVFGGARRQEPGTNNLSFSTSVLGGYDTNILLDNLGGIGGGPTGSSEATASTLLGGNASLQWTQSRTRVAYYGNVGADYRKFFDVDDFDLLSGGGIAGLSYQITPRQTLGLNGQAGLQPFYQFGVIGGAVPGFGNDTNAAGFVPDQLAARELVFRYGAAVDYTWDIAPRLNFSAAASRTGFEPANDAASEAQLRGLGGTTAGARLRYSLAESLGIRAGYAYTTFDNYSPGLGQDGLELQAYATHNVDLGFDYSDSLTLAPRTTVSFGTGTVLTTNSGGVGSVNQGTTFSVVGFAALQKQFLRSWAASINYNRSVAYIELSNSVGTFDLASASIGGLFTDRLDASAGASYVHGAPFVEGAAPLRSLTAGAQLRYAMTVNAAAFVSYTYGFFDQEYRSAVIPSSPLNFSPARHGVRVGLTLWFDLLR